MTDVDRLSDWVRLVHDVYPPSDAEDWDAVGVHVGAPGDPVSRVLVTLDVTRDVIDEAVENGAELVLAHHPLLFRPLARLTPDTAAGAIALHAARNGRCVLAAHTNLDVALPGTSDPVVDLLGLVDVRPLRSTASPQQFMLVTFVPTQAAPTVLDALAGAGAGRIGEYTSCSFRAAGTGTFRPSASTNPTVGAREELNEVAEDRLEMVVDDTVRADVVAALLRTHPYEEVAYHLHPLAPTGSTSKGLGRIGELPEPRSLGDVARRIARDLPSPHLRLAGEPEQSVSRVAVCGGAGESLVHAARARGAELYVTGDLRHHPTLDARAMGLSLIDAGHYWTEAAALPGVVERLDRLARTNGLRAGLLASTVRTDPWTQPERWLQGRVESGRQGAS